jgi:hypothetical protein
MTLASKPLKTAAPPNITEYFFSVYFADFEFVTVTYTGKVKYLIFVYLYFSKKEADGSNSSIT